MTAGSGSEAGGQSGSGEAESQTSGEDRCRMTSGGGVTSDQPQVSPVWCRDHGQRSSDDFTVRPIFGKRCNFVEKIAAG